MINDSRKRIIKISAAVNEKDIEHMKLYILGVVQRFMYYRIKKLPK